MVGYFAEKEAFQRKLERTYVKREKKNAEKQSQDIYLIQAVDEKTGVTENLGIVIPGKNLEISSETR